MGLRNKQNKPASIAVCNSFASQLFYFEKDLARLEAIISSKQKDNYITTDKLIEALDDSIAEIERIKQAVIDYEQSDK